MATKEKFINLLRWSEKYTRTDMIYLAKGGFWLSFTTAIVSFIAFLKMVAFGRFLPQEDYGIYSYVIAISGILALFSLPGINKSIIKSVAQGKEGTFLLALKTKLKWSIIGSIISLVASLWYFLNGNAPLGGLFLIVATFFPFFNSFNVFSSFWQAKKKFKTYSKYEITTASIIALLIIPTVFLTNNIAIILLMFFLSQSFFYGIIVLKTRKEIKNKEEDKGAISFGKDLTIMEIIATLASHVDKVIIWKFLGPVQVAIYSFAQTPVYKIRGLIPISTLALPKLGERNIKEIKGEIIKKFKKLFLVSIPLTLFVILVAPLLFKIAFPRYIESVPYFQFFSLILILCPFQLITSALISEMKKKNLYILNIVSPVLKIILFVALIPFFGIWGIIASILISSIVGSSLTLYFFIKI